MSDLQLAPELNGQITTDTASKLMLQGDLSGLNDEQLKLYYIGMCQSAGLNFLQRPFNIMTLQGKKVLYANKDCTAQLTAIHRLSVAIVSKSKSVDGLYEVVTRVTKQDGSYVEDIGVVPYNTAEKPDVLSNAIMKCTTKSKRRTILSACGIGVLDETEVAEIKNAYPEALDERLLDDGFDSALASWTTSIEGCATIDELDKVRLDMKEIESAPLKKALDHPFTEACRRLNCAWSKTDGKLVEVGR